MKSNNIIRLSKSCIGESEKNAVMDVLDREFLGMGSEVQEFELALSDYFGRTALCAVNGTAALHLALQACGIGIGDEVLVQSLTYIASFQAISATSAVPIACDLNPDTLTIDLQDAERRITSKTKAIMPVHYSGGVGALADIYTFAEKHNLRVIEDAAHSFGTSYNGKRIGGFGDIACFSFDGIKNITSGEGGCIVCDDVQVIKQFKDARLLGVQKDSEKRFDKQRSWEFDVSSQGWRYHMSNIMAAIGIEQLKRLPEFSIRRQKLALIYDKLFSASKLITTLCNDYTQVVPHIYPVILDNSISREFVRKELLKMGIQTGIHYQPNHHLTMYASPYVNLKNTDIISPYLLTLPMHPDLSDDDVNYISKCLKLVINDEG